MLELILYSTGFVLIHILVSGTDLRGKLIGLLGNNPYMALYNVVSLALVVGMVVSYNAAPMVETWGQVVGLRWLAAILMLFAFILLLYGVVSKNPTAFGKEENIHNAEVARGILRITRHPVLNAIGLWAFTHIIYNGDQASLIFFGAFLITAIAGMPSIDAKLAKAYGDEWHHFAKQTSRLPFAAILAGRNRLMLKELSIVIFIIALVAYALFITLHARLFGVAVL